MIGRRCGGATSQEATGKFSSPAPLPDRCCAASNVMGAWYHKQRAACDIAGNPNRQCRRLDDLLMPRDGPIGHVLADRPSACATAFRRANWPRKWLAGRAIEHGRFVVLRQLDRSERVAQGGRP